MNQSKSLVLAIVIIANSWVVTPKRAGQALQTGVRLLAIFTGEACNFSREIAADVLRAVEGLVQRSQSGLAVLEGHRTRANTEAI